MEPTWPWSPVGASGSHADDREAQGRAYFNMGAICIDTGEYERAIQHINKNIDIARAMTDREAEADALFNLGPSCVLVAERRGRVRHRFEPGVVVHLASR